MRYLKGLLLPALLGLVALVAAKNEVSIESTPFDNELVNLMYFDDSGIAMVQELENGKIWRSTDAGKGWKQIDDMLGLGIIKNPYDKQVAIVLGETKHWITYDQGANWRKFETKLPPSPAGPIGWHAQDNEKVMIHEIEDCWTTPCLGKTFYTLDGFKTDLELLVDGRKSCLWAKSTDLLLQDHNDWNSRVLCITRGKYSGRSKDFRLLQTDDYFKSEKEVVMSSGRSVRGASNMVAIKGFIVVAVKPEHSSELSLYATTDTQVWHHSEFGDGKIEEDGYTILESTNYSIQVDVMTSKYVNIGNLYSSNSNGTYFTENVAHTNRDGNGMVDFEKVSNIQGVVLVNTVDNWAEAKNGQAKKLKSKISFDDGRTFEKLSVKGEKGELHLHSVTDLRNSGRVFSSPAPGLVMGVGNIGEYLGRYSDGNLYVSDDAGLNWELALEQAHKYEFGDQGSVLVAVYDKTDTREIRYSLKHGRKDTWETVTLPDKVRARELTTLADSTSLKFLLYATRRNDDGLKHVLYQIDFTSLNKKTCEDEDFEAKWPVRKDSEGHASCVMGHKQLFRRRKWDADCFVNKAFDEELPSFEPCECDAVRDYECDFNFKPEGEGKDKKCVRTGALKLPKDACGGKERTFKGPSGWRKIPGNQCKGTTDREKEVEWNCEDADAPPSKNEHITSELKTFKGSSFMEHYYLERPNQGSDGSEDESSTDETIVMRTDERTAWITHDHGKNWDKAVDDEIIRIYAHPYNTNYVYFLTASKKVWYSEDRGLRKSIHSFDAPELPSANVFRIMEFHPDSHSKDWLIWMGGKNCNKVGDKDCHTVAYVSQKNGQSWDVLVPYVKKCQFVWREEGRNVKKERVFCEQYKNEEMGASLQLLISDDMFKNKQVQFDSVVEFATMAEFIVVATKDTKTNELHLYATLDGHTFAEAKFPPKFFEVHQTAYTVLESSTHAMFLHVTVNDNRDQEYGSIIKSNSNGTSYVMSLNGVNRNSDGYVDFEKMQGIEGVAVANIVANDKEVDQGAKKKKQSRITHNDGAEWEALTAPKVDSNNKAYDCEGACSLHIHGYTERSDPREQYSSPTAVGLMFAVGNVGSELTTFGEANTFMTTDAGVTWKEVKKGVYAWEFGDQGSVIVIVRRGEDTDHLYYTLDNGDKWDLYKFADHRIRVEAITTVPSDTSLNFLLWGKDGRELVTINVDFSGIPEFQHKCKLDEKSPSEGDYDLWSPQHPLQTEQDCLFGHVAQYHRKRAKAQCRNGMRIDHMHNIARNCSCTRQDYECAYNFERQPGGLCTKIASLPPADPQEVCTKGAKEYWDNTPYRKIPLSTCDGGQEFEKQGDVHACPGFEEDFAKKHGMSRVGIFLAVVLPFAAAAGIGYYVWRNWDGKFGKIRLGDSSGGFDSEAPWIKWPVAAISGVVAVVAAVPLLVGSIFRLAASRMGGGYGGRTYTSRNSFARNRGDYAVVDADEGELLGEDSDDEV